MENKGGKRPDYQIVLSTNDGLKKEGAAWLNTSKKGTKYISLVFDNGLKYMLMKNTPKPENTEQKGYRQSSYGQRDNQQPTRLADSYQAPVTNPDEIEF